MVVVGNMVDKVFGKAIGKDVDMVVGMVVGMGIDFHMLILANLIEKVGLEVVEVDKLAWHRSSICILNKILIIWKFWIWI